MTDTTLVVVQSDPTIVEVSKGFKGDTGATGATGAVPWGAPASWMSATAYVVGPPASLVTYNGGSYVCTTSHTSGGSFDGTKWAMVTTASPTGFGYTIDGGGAVLRTGIAGTGLIAPCNGTITAVTVVADVVGSMVIDIWKTTYAGFPPSVANTITASAKPTLDSAQKYTDSTLTGWTKTINAGDVIYFNVDSCSTITAATVVLTVTRT